MSVIADYASLLIDAGEYSGRNDIAHLFPRFVGLAEAKLNRVLRIAQMEKTATLALIDGNGPLPTDFLEMRQALSSGGRVLRAWDIQSLSARYGALGGVPAGYAIVGSTLQARPKTTGDMTITYYARIPGLTADAPSNWLLAAAPDVYLFGLVEEIAIWAKDTQGVADAKAMKESAISGVNLTDERARWGDAQVTLGGNTP